MPKKVKSARGVTVDFDLLRIKEQMASEPAPMDVAARQQHIDSRMRRRMRNTRKTQLSTTPTKNPQSDVVDAKSPDLNDTSVVFIDPNVDAKSPDLNDTSVVFIDPNVNATPPESPKQKAKPKPKPPTQD